MGYLASCILCLSDPFCTQTQKFWNSYELPLRKNCVLRNPGALRLDTSDFRSVLVVKSVSEVENTGSTKEEKEEKPRYRWLKIGSDISEEQKQAIAQIPRKMENRCQSLLKQIICFSPERGTISMMLAVWVKSMNPRRADWLSVLKQLERLNNPFYFEVLEHALTEESFEPNIRDYTMLINGYAKHNKLQEAENTLLVMKNRGFIFDQVILTALVHMYSKAGNLKLAEASFEEMKLIGTPLDRRSYGSMIMAYIRAGMLETGETLLREMEGQEIYAGREVYKALLRAYSMTGDSQAAQRVFDASQLAGIIPDVKVCGLLINAYVMAGQTREALIAFDNLRKAGLEPNDKCVALVLAAYEKENKLNDALQLLIDLEKDGVVIGKESSEFLVKWFRNLGVVEEVETVLRDYTSIVPEPAL